MSLDIMVSTSIASLAISFGCVIEPDVELGEEFLSISFEGRHLVI
jgi:hypothetical protein